MGILRHETRLVKLDKGTDLHFGVQCHDLANRRVTFMTVCAMSETKNVQMHTESGLDSSNDL